MKQPKKVSPRVRTFCAKFFQLLDEECWGDIEPDIFLNLAEGNLGQRPDGLSANKYSQEDMLSAVKSMNDILEKAL